MAMSERNAESGEAGPPEGVLPEPRLAKDQELWRKLLKPLHDYLRDAYYVYVETFKGERFEVWPARSIDKAVDAFKTAIGIKVTDEEGRPKPIEEIQARANEIGHGACVYQCASRYPDGEEHTETIILLPGDPESALAILQEYEALKLLQASSEEPS